MANLLTNPSFEDGWRDVVYGGRLVQVPNGWTLNVLPVGATLESLGAFDDIDHTPIMERVATIPEIVHKKNAQLPPDEQIDGEDALILDGDHVYKIFGAGPYGVTLSQTVTGLRPGALLGLKVPVQPHYQPMPGGDGSPGACAFRVFSETEASAWATYSRGLTDRAWAVGLLLVKVPAHGSVTVGAVFEGRSEAGIDFFTDLWSLDYVDVPEPEPEHKPNPVDYVVVVNLLPKDTAQAEYAQVLGETYDRRESIVYSADDAARLVAPGLPGSLVRVYDSHRWQDDIVQWLKDHGVTTVLEVRFSGSEPLPPSGGEPQSLPAPGILIGLHCQRVKTGMIDYYRKVRPGVFKGFTLGQCIEVKQASPNTLVVYRHHVDNDGYWISQPNPKSAARGFLDLYSADLAVYSANSGMTIPEILRHIDVFESVNEVIGTRDDDLLPGVAFDVAFAEAIEERYGEQVKAGMLTIAVGNPHESEVIQLLPAARVSSERGHYLAYHPYWAANQTTSFLRSGWPYHAGRWQEWDKVFREHGVYPRYYGGESGICFAPDGWSFQANRGWKSCGSFGKYIPDLLEFDRLAFQWNALHGNRFRGTAIFCYGGYGWEDFDFEPGDLAELAEALV